jgi:hypothetical protein
MVKEGVGRCTVDGTAGHHDDVDEMVSNKCIHKKINHYLLTLLLLQIVAKGTTEMCVHIAMGQPSWCKSRDDG